MTAMDRLGTKSDEAAWRALWRAYLDFAETSKPEEIYAKTWQRILDPQEDIFSCLAEKDGQVNFLYHTSFWDIEDRCYLNDLYVKPETRGARAGEALIDAVVSHASGRNSAQVYWLTAKDNVQAHRLYETVANLTPFVKYQV